MWVGPTDLATLREVEAIVHQQDEGIARSERVWTHDLHRGVPLPDEPGFGMRRGIDARNGAGHSECLTPALESMCMIFIWGLRRGRVDRRIRVRPPQCFGPNRSRCR